MFVGNEMKADTPDYSVDPICLLSKPEHTYLIKIIYILEDI
jgi:hypothetical protein